MEYGEYNQEWLDSGDWEVVWVSGGTLNGVRCDVDAPLRAAHQHHLLSWRWLERLC